MEEVFAQARNAEATAEELLVDDGWKLVEIEPETIGVNGNGTTATAMTTCSASGRPSSWFRSTGTRPTGTATQP